MRCAIYFIPPREHPLCALAGAWLRRDPYTGLRIDTLTTSLGEERHAAVTAAPRRYGFHATIKAPFRLAEPWTVEDVASSLDDFTLNAPSFGLDLGISEIGEFFAYVSRVPSDELSELADQIVTAFDPFRAPLDETDLARRNLDRLPAEQRHNVMTWGYPYVFDQFRFHMTLTGALSPSDMPTVRDALDAHFGTAPYRVDVSQLVLAVEPAAGAPFVIHSVHRFAAARERLTA